MSTAITGQAPLAIAPIIVLRPTPPIPKTTTELPGLTWAVLTTAPTPVIIAQLNKTALSSGKDGSTTTKDASWATVNVEKAETPI
jgi:hypothetical protein